VVSRHIFLFFILIIAALQLYRAVMAIRNWPVTGSFSAAALRLTAFPPDGSAADGSPPLAAAARAGIAAVGLLQDGCMLPPVALAPAGDGSSVAAFGAAAPANGYYFLAIANKTAGPAHWTLEAAADANGTGGWTPVGASAWRINPQASPALRAPRSRVAVGPAAPCNRPPPAQVSTATRPTHTRLHPPSAGRQPPPSTHVLLANNSQFHPARPLTLYLDPAGPTISIRNNIGMAILAFCRSLLRVEAAEHEGFAPAG
jgi:hypothetical protein